MTKESMSSTHNSSKWNNVKRKIKKLFYLFLLLLFITGGIYIYWKFYFTYSDGYRAGLLQKFSNKGTIFKTYEGEMILSSISSNRNVPLASEKFLFSVTDNKIANVMDTIQGQMVVVHYRQKNGLLIWRGESTYVVDSVKIKP